MIVLNSDTAPRYIDDSGATGHLLVSPRTCDARRLAVSYVEVRHGGEKSVHTHEPEQVYYIIAGRGTMTVGRETATVVAGDCIHVPPHEPHGIRNDGSTVLKYLGVVSPSFTNKELSKFWSLDAERAAGRSEGRTDTVPLDDQQGNSR